MRSDPGSGVRDPGSDLMKQSRSACSVLPISETRCSRSRIAGLDWIRLLYLYPTTITDDVLAAMAECKKVCRYVDLPLQHASAAVLKRMRRPGNRRTYDALLSRIRERVPGVALRTTLIVG